MLVSNKKPRAFGLIEVLIAVTIIAIIMAALVGIARMVLINTVRAQERAQSVRLAQEGIEIVRQIRDTAWIDRDNTTEWDKLVFRQATADWAVPDPSINYKIAFDTSSPEYRYYLEPISAGTDGAEISSDDSKFYRKVEATDLSNLIPENGGVEIRNYAKKVTVKVLEPGGKTVEVSEIMTNWRPNF